jgi:hypothetical protein
MPRRTAFSAQTLAVLAARPSDWRHGYDVARETGLKSGTLYPILVRLADREIVQPCWEEGELPDGPGATCTGSPPTGWRRRRPHWRRRLLRQPGRRGPVG